MVCVLVSIYVDSPRLGHTIKTNCIKRETADLKISFDILEKRLGLVSLSHFVFNFKGKSFSCYILTDQISLTDCLYFRLGSMGIVII